jgi:ketosteroid isomerase-like protein
VKNIEDAKQAETRERRTRLAGTVLSVDTGRAMSQENVEIVRQLIADIWAQPDPPDLSGRVHPQVEIVTSPDFPEQTVLSGFAAFERWTRRWSEMFRDYDLQPERFWDQGDAVVVALHERATAGRSGIPIDDHYAHVWTFREGVVTRVQVFRSADQALEAAGLRESDAGHELRP